MTPSEDHDRAENGYPRFSAEEMGRRRRAVEAMMERAGVDHLVAYGAGRVGSAVQWLSEWPVTQEAALFVTPGREDVLLVQHYNHLPNARRIASGADVRWGGPSTIETLGGLMGERAEANRVGVVGPLRHSQHRQLSERVADLVALDGEYTTLRLVKSAEEVDRLRRAARLSDAAVAAVAEGTEVGMEERALAALAEGAYLAEGATNHIHYFAVTSMDDPSMCVPAQFPSDRRIRPGDVLFCEISANYWGYAGQVLRTFTVAADPPDLFIRLHDTAQAAYAAITAAIHPGAHPRELVEAAGVIEESGFTIYDDLVHGYGGGYLPPVLGSASRAHRPVPDLPLEEGMALVVQPNVITPDERAGVQTGELGVVTARGWESLHSYPGGMGRIG
ncbi:MAG: M24 family metallopeptidase [Actinomycetota bacterium]